MNRLHQILCSCIFLVASCGPGNTDVEWPVYGGSNGRMQYSPLKQIDTLNVHQLETAWIYQTGDAGKGSQMQTNPLIADQVLYGVSPRLTLFAVDALSGKEKWKFSPPSIPGKEETLNNQHGSNACRGLAIYRDEVNGHRLFYTVGSFLYCVNANTGLLQKEFGDGGKVSLHEGLDDKRPIAHLRVTSTSPGIIYKDLLIMGSSLGEEAEAAPGHIRAYDVHTGRIRWIFHTIPHPGEAGYETWMDTAAYRHAGGANAWGGFSLDEERGIVFTATGTANPDFYGGNRAGANLYANSILALDAATGKKKWHFQTIHHDLWDWDLPTAPVLATIAINGKKRDAVVQVTKQGYVFVFDRESGKPLHPIEEKPVPTVSELPGEWLSPTQPAPVNIAPFIRQELRVENINRVVPDSSYQELLQRFQQLKQGPAFTPPSLRGTIVMALNGGAEWGGPSIDPETGILYINANEMPWIIAMKKNIADQKNFHDNMSYYQAGSMIYSTHCRSCHGEDRKGAGPVPSLESLQLRMQEKEFRQLVRSGRRMMPAFSSLGENEMSALASYLLSINDHSNEKFTASTKEVPDVFFSPYVPDGYQQFLSKEGYPAIDTPWGTLNALDLNTGNYLWRKSLGETELGKARGIATGSMNYGGSVVTAGGLLLIAATADEKFRAYNKRTGELLFETALPAAAFATPAVYSIQGQQFITLACGGGRAGKKSGDYYITFRLKQ